MNRKYTIFIGAFALAMAGMVAAPSAEAGTVSLTLSSSAPSTTIFTISGTYAPTVPSTSMSAPGDTYSMSFTLPTNPSSLSSFSSSTSGGYFELNADLTFSLNGGASMSFATPFTFFFYTNTGSLPNLGGVLVCFQATTCTNTPTYWNIFGQQLFTGSVSSPTLGIPGLTAGATLNASVNEKMSGYLINNNGPFPFLYVPPTTTPEPASLFLLGTGLFGLGLFARKKMHMT